jgi:hypothetical protein
MNYNVYYINISMNAAPAAYLKRTLVKACEDAGRSVCRCAVLARRSFPCREHASGTIVSACRDCAPHGAAACGANFVLHSQVEAPRFVQQEFN